MAPMNQNLIRITDEEKKKIRQEFEMDDEEKLRDGVAALVDWCSKQHHFVEKNLNKIMLEKSLLLSKGSVEEAKIRIDRVLTTRGMMENLVLNSSTQEIKQIFQMVKFTALPKLNPMDQSRVNIIQFLTQNIDVLDITVLCRSFITVSEYRHNFDYALGERYVYDFKNINVNFFRMLSENLATLRKIQIFTENVYGLKIKGLHILNAPSFIDKVVFLLKQILKGKLTERIYVHSTYEDFQKHVSKEVLPSDYDEEEQPMSKLHEQWVEEISSPAMEEYFIASNRLVTDESKRIDSNPYTEEYLGIPGNFRQLNVD